eukprot:703788-Prymnesium_polylepis.2
MTFAVPARISASSPSTSLTSRSIVSIFAILAPCAASWLCIAWSVTLTGVEGVSGVSPAAPTGPAVMPDCTASDESHCMPQACIEAGRAEAVQAESKLQRRRGF